MHGGRNVAVGLADQLALQHAVAGLDQRMRRAADALVQRHDQSRRQRRDGDRLARRLRLVGRRLDAAVEVEQLAASGVLVHRRQP